MFAFLLFHVVDYALLGVLEALQTERLRVRPVVRPEERQKKELDMLRFF